MSNQRAVVWHHGIPLLGFLELLYDTGHFFCHLWISSISGFPPLEGCMHLLVPQKLVLKEQAFRSVPSQRLLGLVTEVHGIFNKKALTFHLWGTSKDNSNRLYVLQVGWTILTTQKRAFHDWCWIFVK